MTKTGNELADVGRALSWGALASFVSNISPDSALAREINPKVAVWATRAKTNAILADIFDMLASINANLVAVGNGKRAKKPKRYERPTDNSGTKRLGGKGALPHDELVAWIEEKRRKHAEEVKRNARND